MSFSIAVETTAPPFLLLVHPAIWKGTGRRNLPPAGTLRAKEGESAKPRFARNIPPAGTLRAKARKGRTGKDEAMPTDPPLPCHRISPFRPFVLSRQRSFAFFRALSPFLRCLEGHGANTGKTAGGGERSSRSQTTTLRHRGRDARMAETLTVREIG